MPVTEKLSKLIVEKVAASEIQKQAMEEGMLTMKQDGYVKVLEGVTTMDEVLRVAQY
jgi:type IV pilus assembly protein PilB